MEGAGSVGGVPLSVLWFRRDLRLHDNPALLRAAENGPVVPLFVVDPRLWDTTGGPRVTYLRRSLAALAGALAERGGRLVLRRGDPVAQVTAVSREAGADRVLVSAETTPYGRRRDARAEAALEAQGGQLVRVGSPYAVGPGRLSTAGGTPFRVFTPYWRAWLEHGWAAPAALPAVRWAEVAADPLPDEGEEALDALPAAGEQAARAAWAAFRDGPLARYGDERNRADRDLTSRLSVHLKYGELHPRTLLADLAELERRDGGRSVGVGSFRRQLCWREFYADLLWHVPSSAWTDLRPDMRGLRHDEGPAADAAFTAWVEGRTGYPFVDAGMRQLAAESYVHNRVRLVVASFLTKDLHLPWQRGARLFAERLVDYDLASNNHGWQWVAGTGSDAAPYHRVLNPVTQGRRFDPDGTYVRRWVPELREVPGGEVHEPWELPDGLPAGYPERIVDHAEARREALARYAARQDG